MASPPNLSLDLAAASFFLPIVGYVLCAMWWQKRPREARQAGAIGLAGSACSCCGMVGIFVVALS